MKNGKCSSCRYRFDNIFDYPCNKCIHGAGIVERFEYDISIDTAKKQNVIKQPTVPPMPKVKPPRGRELSGCLDCRHFECDSEEYPCSDCKHNFNAKSENEHFSPINEKLDDINHPDRYAGGRYECIDVMVDVFGVQAVKDFCKLNAFKYLWREEKKGGIEDAKKAIWYLEKFIELGEKNDIKRSD